MSELKASVKLSLQDELAGPAAKTIKKVKAELEGVAGPQNARNAGEAAKAQKQQAAALEDVARKGQKASKELDSVAQSAVRADKQRFNGLKTGLEQVSSAGQKALRTLGQVAGAAQKTSQIGMSIGAAGSVGAMAMRKPIDYERRLTLMAGTAYGRNGATADDIAAGRTKMMAAVTKATSREFGGGTRDEAAEALNKMTASGALEDVNAAMAMLPTIQKFAHATGASSSDLADIATAGVNQGYFKPEEIEDAFNIAFVGGQNGGYELKDMALQLPQLMASYSGGKSKQGFESLVAYLQGSLTTAGSTAQAGNNVFNQLGFMNSEKATKAFADEGIDLAKALTEGLEKGEMPLETFTKLIKTQVIGKNPEYQALQAKMKGAAPEELKAIQEAQLDILAQTALGKVVADRQTMMSILAGLSREDYIASVRGELKNSKGAVEPFHQAMNATTFSHVQGATNAKDQNFQNVLEATAPAIKGLADVVTGATAAFPGLTTALTMFATMLAMITAANMAGGLLRAGGAKTAVNAVDNALVAQGGKEVGKKILKEGAEEGAKAVAKSGFLSGLKKMAAPVLKNAGGLAVVAMDTGVALASDGTVEEKSAALTGVAGSAVGMVAGGKAGAAIGSFFGPLGTAIGGFLGGTGGAVAGSELGQAAYKEFDNQMGKLVQDETAFQMAINPNSFGLLSLLGMFDNEPKKSDSDVGIGLLLPVLIALVEAQKVQPVINLVANLDGQEISTTLTKRFMQEARRFGQ